jgi:hypothetical protein
MGEIVTICLFLCTGLSAGLARRVHRRETQARRTREWIDFLTEDLALTRT